MSGLQKRFVYFKLKLIYFFQKGRYFVFSDQRESCKELEKDR